jgi:hypothetical protein
VVKKKVYRAALYALRALWRGAARLERVESKRLARAEKAVARAKALFDELAMSLGTSVDALSADPDYTEYAESRSERALARLVARLPEAPAEANPPCLQALINIALVDAGVRPAYLHLDRRNNEVAVEEAARGRGLKTHYFVGDPRLSLHGFRRGSGLLIYREDNPHVAGLLKCRSWGSDPPTLGLTLGYPTLTKSPKGDAVARALWSARRPGTVAFRVVVRKERWGCGEGSARVKLFGYNVPQSMLTAHLPGALATAKKIGDALGPRAFESSFEVFT